jgi:hypothetical protein
VAADVTELSRLAQRVDLCTLGNRLPGVFADLRLVAHTSAGTERELVMGLWAQACQAARQLTYTLGYGDLAAVVADRLHWAAVRSGDPLAVGVADAERAHDLIGVGEWDAAHRLLAARLDELDDRHLPAGPAGPATLSVCGYLHLRSALARAGAGDAAGTWDHVREAEELARRVGGDRNDYRLAFGPTNVAIWSVSLAVEMMDGTTAVSRAGRVRPSAGLPVERAGHHQIDLARGQLLHGDRAAALEALLTARRICPQQTRFHPMARETVYDLANTERRRSDSLRGLATWMGLDD